TREAIDAAGWMHTGDLATIDAEGYANIVGRVKDMLIRGGENVYPREVEEYLLRHPAIQDAQVFGVPDAKYSEEVCFWLVARRGSSGGAGLIRGGARCGRSGVRSWSARQVRGTPLRQGRCPRRLRNAVPRARLRDFASRAGRPTRDRGASSSSPTSPGGRGP